MKEAFKTLTKVLYVCMAISGIVYMIQSTFNNNQLNFIQGLLMVIGAHVFSKE